jgi:hypothetical protein
MNALSTTTGTRPFKLAEILGAYDAVTRSEAAIIARARASCRRAMESPWPTSPERIGMAIYDLYEAMELYSDMENRAIHPGSVWPDLECEDGVYDTALRRAADDVRAGAEELSRLLPAARDAWLEGVTLHSVAAARGRTRS